MCLKESGPLVELRKAGLWNGMPSKEYRDNEEEDDN